MSLMPARHILHAADWRPQNAMAVADRVLLIQQMREMVQAIMRTDIQDMADIVEAVVECARKRSSKVPVPSDPLHLAQVYAIKAVLKAIDGVNFFEHEADVSAGGQVCTPWALGGTRYSLPIFFSSCPLSILT